MSLRWEGERERKRLGWKREEEERYREGRKWYEMGIKVCKGKEKGKDGLMEGRKKN